MEIIPVSIVNFTSPAARNAFGRVKLSGQIKTAIVLNQRSTSAAIRVASGERENTDTIGTANTNKTRFMIQSPR